MKHFRKNEGFTLVELMVSILIGTIITGAAVTVLLLGLRMNRSSIDTASRQNTTRILMSVLENLASEGKITNVKTTLQSWEVIEKAGNTNGTDKVLLSYSAENQAIYTGKADTGTPILEGVYASHVSLEGQLLVISVQTEDGSYTSSIYCRMSVTPVQDDEVDKENQYVENVTKPENVGNGATDNKEARAEFLRVLLSQKDRTVLATTTYNPGLILVESQDANGNTIYVSKGEYYTQWYVGGTYKDGWNKDTPWCVAYISWCLEETKYLDDGNYQSYLEIPTNSSCAQVPKYANVDTFLNDLKQGNTNGSYITRVEHSPQPGDLVFFDWDSGTDPEHMGVVLSVAGGYIYTIEGNTAGRVALRQYSLSDSRIIGYGVLNWK